METTFKKRNIFLMLFLTVITFGIYIPIWFFKQQDSINRLISEKKINSKLLVLLLMISIVMVMPIATAIISLLSFTLLAVTGAKVFSGIALVTFVLTSFFQIKAIDWVINGWVIKILLYILILILAFRVQNILNDHFNKKLNRDIIFSDLLTFFFTIYYLQYKLNRLSGNSHESLQTNS